MEDKNFKWDDRLVERAIIWCLHYNELLNLEMMKDEFSKDQPIFNEEQINQRIDELNAMEKGFNLARNEAKEFETLFAYHQSKQPPIAQENKDYRIESFKHNCGEYVYGYNSKYNRTDYRGGIISLSRVPNSAKIKSVLRLSDNSVWSVDEITEQGKIISFRILKDKMNVEIECELPFYTHFDLSGLSKQRIPLFVTFDNVPIYEGDIYWTVEKDFNLLYSGAASKIFESGTNKSCKYFSTEQSANEYILYNKKELSLNDLLSVWDEHAMFPKPQEHYKSAVLFKSFENLVKQKIKQLTK